MAIVNKYSVCFGEILLRLSTPDNKRFYQSDNLNMGIGGAECNVAINLSALGIPSKIITTLSNNILGDYALSKLRQFNLNTQDLSKSNERMGSYFLEVGAPNLKSKITYDRNSSGFSLHPSANYDWDLLLADADHLHASGINLAISNICAKSTCEALKKAHAHEILVSFDCNYRPALWKNRTQEAITLSKSCLKYADVAFITEKDIQLILDLPKVDSNDLKTRLDAYSILFQHFPNLKMLASTFRTYDHQGKLSYQGILFDGKSHVLSQTFHIPFIIDRIGTGDAFAAGIIYGLKMNFENQQVINFATALATVKHSIKGDYAGVNKAVVLEAMQQEDSDVKR